MLGHWHGKLTELQIKEGVNHVVLIIHITISKPRIPPEVR